ncbi:MAG TPA: DinB family protein [Symbiobacteriaceae bacterium]|nr:DinB family protein [Symbiobacteriaceae bacterium]
MPTLDVKRFEGVDPVVAAFLSTLEFGRGRLVANIKDLTTEQLDKKPAGFKNSVASLAVHVAATEVAFAHRFMGKPVPEDLLVEFPPHKMTDPLPEVTGLTAQEVVGRLERSRSMLLEAVQGLKAADLRQEIALGPDRTASFEWLLALLPVHLASHTGHIQMIVQHL